MCKSGFSSPATQISTTRRTRCSWKIPHWFCASHFTTWKFQKSPHLNAMLYIWARRFSKWALCVSHRGICSFWKSPHSNVHAHTPERWSAGCSCCFPCTWTCPRTLPSVRAQQRRTCVLIGRATALGEGLADPHFACVLLAKLVAPLSTQWLHEWNNLKMFP